MGGRLEALMGAINVRDPSFIEKADVSLIGGDILSRELNIYSGSGVVNVDVGQLTGPINIYGSAAYVTAATDALQIGKVELTAILFA